MTDIFANGLLSKELPIGFAHMEIQIAESSADSSTASSAETNLTYLYRSAAISPTLVRLLADLARLHSLSPSIEHTSHAAACASLFGISPSILSRASEISNALLRFDLDSILNTALTAEEQAGLRDGEQVGRRLLEWDTGAEEWMHEEVGRDEVKKKLAWVLGLLEEGEGEEMGE